MKKILNYEIENLNKSLISEIAEKAKITPNCINLTYGEPDFYTPKAIKKEAIISILNNKTKYENTRGNPFLIEEILKHERKYNNYSYTDKEILITNGATEAIYLALCTILNNDDEVIVPSPYYPEYIPVIKRSKANINLYPNDKYNFQLDYESLEKLITPKTKCLILNSPNNPTGVILNKKSIEIAYKLVKKYNLFLLLDNCYEKIIFKNNTNFSNYNDIKDNLIICQSFSKTYSMTGWRLGYLLGPNNVIDSAMKLHQYINTSITSFVQTAAINALSYDFKNNIKEYKKRMKYAYQRLINMNLDVVKPDGAFYLFPSIKEFNIDSLTFCKKLLEEKQLALTPGIAFGSDYHIRISLCCKVDILKEALDILESFIYKLKKS